MHPFEKFENIVIRIFWGVWVFGSFAIHSATAEELVADVPYEMKVPTPHVPWARPYHLGKTRALVLMENTVAREVIEFAQRLDLDFKTVTIGGTKWKAPASLVDGWNNATAMKHIWRILKDEQLDVIVLRAPWTFFSEEVQLLIMDRVRAGTGLVYVSYDYHEEEKKATQLFEFVSQGPYVESFGREYFSGQAEAPTDAWKPVADHFVCGALPWNEMKTTTYLYEQTTGKPLVMWDSKKAVIKRKAPEGESKEEAELAREERGEPEEGAMVPMVVASEYGKGRILCVNYNPAWFPGRSNHLIPDLRVANTYTTADSAKVAQPMPRFHVHEYCWALLARCTLWAAGREPQIFVADAQASVQGGEGMLNLETRNKGRTGKLSCELTLRNPDSHILHRASPTVEVVAGDSSLKVSFDASKAEGGLNMVEFRLMNSDGVVDFGAAALRIGGPDLSLKVDRLFGYVADPLPEAVISLGKPLPEGAELILGIEDGNGRLVDETKAKISGQKSRIPLAGVKKLEVPEYFVHARVVKSGRVLAHAKFRALYEVPCLYDDWLYGVEFYAGHFNTWTKLSYQRMREIGIRAGHTTVSGINSAIESRSAGMVCGDISNLMSGVKQTGWRGDDAKRNYQIARYNETGDPKYLVRDPDSNDPVFREENLAKIRGIAPYLRALGIWDNTIIDEYSATVFSSSATVDFSFSKHTLKKFRVWVKTQYKTLDEINEAYGRQKKIEKETDDEALFDEDEEEETDADAGVSAIPEDLRKEDKTGNYWFESWDEVMPVTFRQAKEIGKYAGWVDHRRFMEITSCEYWTWVRDELRKINPAARISLSGTQSPNAYNGHDLWLRCQTLDGVWSYHGGNQAEVMRSFGSRKPGWFDITWTGYAARGLKPSYQWARTLDGATQGTAYWWFTQILNPDFQVSESAANQLAICRPLREGIGQLLIGRKLETSGIAIHYSQASCHVARTRGAQKEWTKARSTWIDLIKTTGRQMDFLSYEELEKGDLVYPRWKVFIFPFSIAMSAQEIAAVREFVKAGGTVIADALPGLTDTHSRNHDPDFPGLDEVFGISRTENSKVGLVRNKFGKGKAYCFNSALEYRRESGDQEQVLELLEKIFNQAGAMRPVSVAVSGGRWQDRPKVYCYREGEQLYVGLLTGGGKGSGLKCTVKLPGGMFVRELVTGKNYGRCDKFEVEMPWRDARFFSALPRTTTAVEVQLPKSSKQGETPTLAIRVRDGSDDPGLRVVRMTVTDPNDKPVWRLEKNVKTPDGRAKIELPFALNDPAGSYTINLRDIASGIEKKTVLDVMPAARPFPPYETPGYPKPATPDTPGLWAGPPGRHVAWDASMISKRARALSIEPWDFSKGLLANPTLLEPKHLGSRLPKVWFLEVRKAGEWIRGKESLKYVTLHEDPQRLFRGKPTTRIEFADDDYGLWIYTQTFTAEMVKRVKNSVIKVKFAAMRSEGRVKPYGYDTILRIRAWAGGALLASADAKAASFKNKWIEASCEMDAGAVTSMDVQLFGKRKETLNITGILFEAKKKKPVATLEDLDKEDDLQE